MDTPDAGTGPLHRALLANAAFSAVSGLLLVLATGWLSPELGLANRWMLPMLGVGLVGFAALLVRVARERPIPLRVAGAVSLADGLWVLGSAALVWLDPTGLTALGRWLVIGVADAVLLFALAQAWGLHLARGEPASGGDATPLR